MTRAAKYQIGIIFIGLLLFLPTTQVHLFDWDEINFAEAAREMLVSGDYLTVTIDYQPFWEKPPLFIWIQALSMSILGVNEFAARLPNLICGLLTLLLIFHIGRKIYNLEFARFWVLAYIGSLLPQFYFMSGIIDPFYNLFIFLSIYYAFQFQSGNDGKYLIFAGVAAGLAVLTKGPVAILVLGLVILIQSVVSGNYQIIRTVFSKRSGLMAIFSFLHVAAIFYGAEFMRHGPTFFDEFLEYHMRLLRTGEAGHGQPFYYHFLVLLLGCLPTSIFLLGGMKKDSREENVQNEFRLLMITLFFSVLVLFSIVETKIIHYSSLCYFPLTYLAARYMYGVAYRKQQAVIGMRISMLTLAGVFSLLLILLPTFMSNTEALIPHINDPFAVANLAADVSWSAWDGVGGYIYFFSLVFFVYLASRRRMPMAYTVLLFGTATGINASVKTLVPKVEQITQNAAITFFESKKDEDCYIEVLDYKSYAHYFYAGKSRAIAGGKKKEELLNGPLTKTTYLVSKNVDADRYRSHPNLELLFEKNGFVFFRRKP